MKRFHEFRLDITNHCLGRGEERLSLAPKAFDLLRYLVDHANRLVTQPLRFGMLDAPSVRRVYDDVVEIRS